MTEACRTDARVALLEASHVAVVLHVGRQMAVPSAIQGDAEQRFRQAGRQDTRTNPFDSAWAQLDSVNYHDLFLTKIPMLKSCPRFFQERLRECLSFALRERFRGKMVGDAQAETRGWKLFVLIPMMLLHRPHGTKAVGREKLGHRAEEFSCGRWTDLISQAQHHRVFAPEGPAPDR